jgi:hypothetical protein
MAIWLLYCYSTLQESFRLRMSFHFINHKLQIHLDLLTSVFHSCLVFSEEGSTSIFRVTRTDGLGTMLAVTSNQGMHLDDRGTTFLWNISSYKSHAPFFVVTAMKTSNFTSTRWQVLFVWMEMPSISSHLTICGNPILWVYLKVPCQYFGNSEWPIWVAYLSFYPYCPFIYVVQ